MSVLRTNSHTFEDQANTNGYVTDQHYRFSIPSRGASSYFQLLPKNYAISQVQQEEVIHTISHTDSDIGVLQVFQSNIDNINGIKFVGKSFHSETSFPEIIDSCEYTTDEEVNDSWTVLNSEHDKNIILETTQDEANLGLYSMKIKCESNAQGNFLKKDFAGPQNWGDFEAFSFYWSSTKQGSSYRWKIVITDSIGQECFCSFNAMKRDTWEHKYFSKTLFSNNEIVDFTKIVSVHFVCESTKCSYFSYLDDFQIIRNVEHRKINTLVSLYHFGPNPDFTTLGDLQTLDDGFPAEDILFDVDTKRISPCALNFGSLSNNRKLTVGDYYGLLIRRPEEGSIKLYGTGTQTFESGNVYDVHSNESMSPLDKSLGFMICTFSDSIIKKIVIKQDVHDKNSNINLLLLNPDNFKVIQFLGVYSFERDAEIVIEYDYSNPEVIELLLNQHLYIYYQDGVTSKATGLVVDARFHYSASGE